MTEDEQAAREKMAEFDAEREESAERWIERMGLEGDEAEAFRNRGRHWILLAGEPVAVGLFEWGKWFENTPQRIVAQDDVVGADGETYWVSTVFLGLDHNFAMSGPPLLFETMIFRRHEPEVVGMIGGREYRSDKAETGMYRWSTLAQAEAGHAKALDDVRNGNLAEW